MEDNLKLWKREARNYQYDFVNSLGDRHYDKVSAEHLASKVGYAMFSAPSEIDEQSKTAAYTKSQQNSIKLVCDKIKSLHPNSNTSSHYYISYVYVMIKLRNTKGEEGIQVLFKIPEIVNDEISMECSLFIDPKPRVYVSWEDYLVKNKLPKCDMCYPADGVYSVTEGSINIRFGRSPACDTSTNVFTGLDVSSALLFVGATGVSLASLAVPIAAPVIWGAAATMVASGTYDTARNMYRLHDIKKHKESLGFKNPDSRSAWLGLAGSVVGMASIGTTAIAKSVVATESAVSRAGILTIKMLNVSSLAVNGIGVVNGIIRLVIKRINGTLETVDIIHFTTACLFFVNAVISYRQANLLIDEMASSDLINLFNLRKNTSFLPTKDIVEFTESKSYNKLRQLVLGIQSHFAPGLNLRDLESIVLKLIVLVENLLSKKISLLSFALKTVELLNMIWKSYGNVIKKVIEEVQATFNVPYWQKVLPKYASTNLEIPRLMCVKIDRVIEYCGVTYHSIEHRNLMTFAHAFSMSHRCKSEKEFLYRFEFYCDCVIAQFREERGNYENELDLQSEQQKNKIFFNKALDKVKHPDFFVNIDELSNERLRRKEETSGQHPFLTSTSSKMYTFCGPLNQSQLDTKFYLDKVADVTGHGINCYNSTIQRAGNLTLIIPTTSNVENSKLILIHSKFLNNCHMGFIISTMK